MNTVSPKVYSPGITSLIPWFYVAWSDTVLSPSEVKVIREQIAQLPFLSGDEIRQLKSWSDPANPPDKKRVRQWLAILKEHAEALPAEKRTSLAEMGLAMAQSIADEGDTKTWSSPETLDALRQLEATLGVVELESYRSIFTPGQQEEVEARKAGFDVQRMVELLDDDYQDIRQRIRQLLKDKVFRYQTLPDKDDYRMQVLEWCRMLAQQGLGALAFPKEYGGQDDMGAYIATFEMLGYHDLSLAIKFGVQFGLFGGSVYALGTKKHHDQYLRRIGTLELPGCFAMTETGHGSNVRGLETTATYDHATREIIVHTPHEGAGKEYIGNALHGQMASVFAQLIVDGEGHGVHAVLVPLRDADGHLQDGIRVADNGYKMGLNGVDNGRLWFDQVRVPVDNLLNRFGSIDEEGRYSSPIENPSRRFFTMLGTLVGGRVSVPRAGLSAAKTGLTIAIRYALKRRQFAPKEGEAETILLDYPSHQRRLMPLLAKAYALDFGLTYLTDRYLQRSEADIREIESLAAGLKSYATWFTTHTLQECREACGGKGYLAENRLSALKADTDIFTTFEGDNTVLMQLVAKGLLSAFRQEFHDEGYRAVMRYLAVQFTDSLSELNPISKRRTDSAHLSDPEFQLDTFRYRERKLLASVSQRMRKLLRRGLDPYDAFLRTQTHLLKLANAYVERVVLEQFVLRVKDTEAGDVQDTLKRLCDLYALHTIESHKGWYLENDFLGGYKTKAIRRSVDRLCKELRLDARALTDAFAIPEYCLAAPIAQDD